MKRILFVALILLMAATVVYAQQQTWTQARQEAQQYLGQSRSNSDQFEATLAELRARNSNNDDMQVYLRIRREIDQLEATINAEQANIEARLDRGQRVSLEVLSRFERMVDQHRVKMAELEVFLSSH